MTIQKVIFDRKSAKNPLKTVPTRPKLPGFLSFTKFYIVGAIAGHLRNVSYVLKEILKIA